MRSPQGLERLTNPPVLAIGVDELTTTDYYFLLSANIASSTSLSVDGLRIPMVPLRSLLSDINLGVYLISYLLFSVTI